jgi:hypothetical protein
MQNQDFGIDFFSDLRFEYLSVEVTYKTQRLLQLNRENGIDSIEIEFLTDLLLLPDVVAMRFPLREFESILAQAKCALLKGA